MQVLGATLDECSVNRRLIKVHNPKEDVVHKVANPFSQDKRSLYFFADPPHLIKTVRNCWNSKCRSMWVCKTVIYQCVATFHVSLYNRTMGKVYHGGIWWHYTIKTHNLV